METSAVVHFWNSQHKWDESTILDQAIRTKELKIKEALPLIPVPQPGRGSGATGLLDSEDEGLSTCSVIFAQLHEDD